MANLWTRLTMEQYHALNGEHEVSPNGGIATYYTSCKECGYTYHTTDDKCATCGGVDTFVFRRNNGLTGGLS